MSKSVRKTAKSTLRAGCDQSANTGSEDASTDGNFIFFDVEKSLGLPPLLPEENIEEFDNLVDLLIEDIKPEGPIAYIYVRDFAIYTYEILRYRRHRNLLIELTRPEAVESLMTREVSIALKTTVVEPIWRHMAMTSANRVKSALSDTSLEANIIDAKSLSLSIDQIEKIERMIASAEARRMTLIREIDRRHLFIKNKLQEAIRNEDGSFNFVLDPNDKKSEKKTNLS